MNKNFSFTKDLLHSIISKGVYHDTHKVSGGLQLSIQSDAGAKTFQVRKKLNGKTIKVVFGRFPDLTINDAREKARYAVSTIRKGIKTKEI